MKPIDTKVAFNAFTVNLQLLKLSLSSLQSIAAASDLPATKNVSVAIFFFLLYLTLPESSPTSQTSK